jgi:dTDP-6-deoxy-L-talose 4-dehydrogenase [NAD(P)+]
MSVIVAGGTGFLGRAICAALAARGLDVVPLSRRAGTPGAVQLDLAATDPAELTELLVERESSVVVNAAGSVWDDDETVMQRSNADLVARIRDGVAKVPWPVRVVHLGTVFEYAPPAPGEYLTEASPCRPASGYGRTKLRGSEQILQATQDGLLDGVVLRITTCAGPGMPRASLLGRVAAQLREAALAGRPAVLRLAPLTAERDFVDSRDVVAAVLAAMTAPVTGAVINVGAGRAVSVRRLVDLLVRASGIPAAVVEQEPAVGRSAGIPWLATRIETAARLLGWRPRHDLTSTVDQVWAAVDPTS